MNDANTELHGGTGGSEGELLPFQCPANVMFLQKIFSAHLLAEIRVADLKFRDYLSAW